MRKFILSILTLFTISIAAYAQNPPTFTSTPVTTASEDVLYTYTALATDLDGNDLTYSASGLPGWLSFVPATRVLSGTPVQADVGSYPITITVNDGTVDVDQDFTIVVGPTNDPPTFTSTPVTIASEDALYTYTALATDLDGDGLTYSASGLPGWLSFVPATRVLSGTPVQADVGSYPITITVNDGTVDVDQDFTIVVGPTNDPPTFTSTPVTTASEDVLYTYTALATDLDGDGLTYSASGLPGWLSFVPATRVLSGTPVQADVGSYPITITVNDGTVDVDQDFTIVVGPTNDPPTFTSTPVTTASEDALYTYTALATDLDGDGLTYSASGLPGWLSFVPATRVLSGTPAQTDVGSYPITITVNDGTVDVDQDFTIVVGPTNDPPTFTSTPVTTASEDALYTYTALATDLDGDGLTYSASGLPGWLSFVPATRVLSGTPVQADVGSYPITITVNDGTVDVDQDFTIVVGPTNDPPTFTSTPVTTASEDALYTYTALATDLDGDGLTYSASGLPGWLSFVPATRVLSGTPVQTDVGSYPITITVNDGTVDVDQDFTIVVGPTNDPPTFTSTPVTIASEDALYTYTALATDLDGDGLTYSASGLPGWLSFVPATRVLSGTPVQTDVGSYPITITVNDGTVDVDQDFTIVVGPTNDPPTFTSTPVTTASEDALYTYTALATDLDGDGLTYSASGLPGWLSFVPATRVLSGTPVQADVGSYPITITVNDGTVDVDQDFTIVVGPTNDPPTFTSTPVTTASEDALYTYTALATDLDGDGLTYSASGLPGWLSFVPATRVLSGTPVQADVGSYPITITVNDGTVDVDQDFTITVNNENDAPYFISTPITAVDEDALYEYEAIATDPDGTTPTYSITVRPLWLSFDPVTRLLTGTPDNDDVGTHGVTLRVTDGTLSDDQSFTITVSNTNDAPTFTSVPVTDAIEDSPYTYTAVATDVDESTTLTYSAPVIPDWLLFNPGTRVLSGTPTDDEVGTHNVTLRVSDGEDFTDQAFVITVENTNDAPAFNSIPNTTATQGTSYFYTATAIDIDEDLLTFTAEVLPEWLNFNEATQLLSGTPGDEHVGLNNVTLRVSDGTLFDDQVFVIDVGNINDAPTFTSLPITAATQGVAYSYTATAEDVDDDLLTFTAELLPTWLIFDEATQILSGTPGDVDVGDNNVTLRVTDGALSEDQSFIIIVANVNDAPTFTSIPLTTGTQDAPYSYTATAEDLDEDLLTFGASLLPTWLNFDEATQILSGTPTNAEVGAHAVTLTVTDGTVTVEQPFVITVGNENDAPTFTSIPDTTASQGTLYTYAVTAVDLDLDDLTFTATTIPLWLSFNDTTNVLSGIPADEDVGDHNVTIRVNDGAVDVDQSFTISVENINDAPSFTSSPVLTATQGTLYTYAVSAEDLDEDSLSFSAPLLPSWLNFNDTTNILSGIPANDDVGDNTVTLRVNDGTVDVDSSFVIVVGDINDAPVFVLIPDTLALQNELYSASISAEDADGDTLTFTAPTLPAWLSFNDTTNVLSGIPGNEDVGDHTVTMRINDGAVDVDTSIVITVENVNDPPTFTSVPDTVALEDVFYSALITAEDIDGDTLSFSAPVLPLWLSFNETTHILSGIPDDSEVGNHSVVLVINDGTEDVLQSFVIEVENANDRPTITSTPVTEARPGVAYEYTVTAMDVDGDALTYQARVLPGWLNFNPSTHVLSATPSDQDIGDQHVSIRVSDGLLYVDHTFVITVSSANHAPTFTSDPTTSVAVGESYVYTIIAQDIDGDALSYSAPVLPDWLTFYPETHMISGIPRSGDIGRHDITLRVTDGTVTADQSFPIYVEDENTEPVFTSTPVTSVLEGELYVYYASAEDVDEDDLIFSAPVLPSWLSFDINTQVLHGTPDTEDVGDHNVTLMVSDGELTATQSFIITVDFKSGLGVDDDFTSDLMLIYPNPSDGIFSIELSEALESEVILEVLDPLGKVLLQQEFPPYTLIREEYNLSYRPAGIYFIRVYNASFQTIKKLMLR